MTAARWNKGTQGMPLSLTLAALWVIAGVGVAMLPMRWQYAPGLCLLVLAVPLLVVVGREVGWIWVALVVFAVVSMYRKPLAALVRLARNRIVGIG